jgi:hypothetical protein
MRIAGIPIQKTHRSKTTRSVKFDYVCRACGYTDPAIVQASVEGTSTNEFGLRDMLVDHEFEAQKASREDSLALAHQRSLFVPCPKCHYVDERALAAMRNHARSAATQPAIIAAVMIGPLLGGLLWFCVQAISISFPDQQALVDKLTSPIFLACMLLVGWIARRVYIGRVMRKFDDELIEMQQDVIFRSRDPERYYEIVESRAVTQR